MKRVLLLLVLGVALSTGGCAKEVRKAEAPLTTSGETTPPHGCVDLRKRGGAC